MAIKLKMDKFIKPSNINSSNVKAIFSTKSLNNNIQAIAGELNFSGIATYFPVQKHTNKIHVLEADIRPVTADAVLTNRRAILIGVQAADCVPVLIYDKDKKVVGAVHAGWRGTAAGILKNTIETMQKRFASLPEDMLIAIGPSIRQCCYEVGAEVKDAVEKAASGSIHYHELNGKYFIDLSSVNKIQALSIGVPEKNIWQSDECTCCNPGRFHSYRYAKDSKGRQGGFIGMW